MNNKLKKIHIVIIVIGMIYLSLSVLNNNIWFDEAYSVGLANHNIVDLCKIAAHDVHPVLYYIILRIFVVIFSKSMIVYRIVSLIPMYILLIFGYTHISKEFGKKVGIYFSFLMSFTPILVHYSTQIRMYSWAMLFVTLTAFYAYKVIKYKDTKSWVVFSIFGVLSAYTHYYALFTIAIINVEMLVYILKKDKNSIKNWRKYAIIQIVAYLPGIITVIMQYIQVVKGFWISISYPSILAQIIESYFKDLIPNKIPLIFSILLCVYIIYKIIKIYKKEKSKAMLAIMPLMTCIFVVLFALIVSIIRPVFITRYMLPMIGLFIFLFAYIISNEDKKILKTVIILGITSLSIYNSYIFLHTVYSNDNNAVKEEMKNNLQKKDIFVFNKIGAGSVVSYYFKDNNSYFYNQYNWNIDEAYKAFAPQMKCVNNLDSIESYNGRIWIIDADNSNVYEEIKDIQNKKVIIDRQKIYNSYNDMTFVITLFENS